MFNLIKKFRKRPTTLWNILIDKKAEPVIFTDIPFNIKKKNINKETVISWLEQGNLREYSTPFLHKKGLEFFFSSYLLAINTSHTVLDAAGGKSNYLDAVKLNTKSPERNLYLTDQIYKGITTREDGINLVGGDISSINLPDCSIDRIACHHAFEHFKDKKDIEFIKECNRILKPNGIILITPIFLTKQYIECWNIDINTRFDDRAELIIDKTASIPGGDEDGHFARFYNYEALSERILTTVKNLGMKYEIIECEVDLKSIPDMKNNFGSVINNPLRALRIIKE